jgi:hypothetical protein
VTKRDDHERAPLTAPNCSPQIASDGCELLRFQGPTAARRLMHKISTRDPTHPPNARLRHLGLDMLALSFSEFDLGCVKTHPLAKRIKYNSPTRHRAVCAQ